MKEQNCYLKALLPKVSLVLGIVSDKGQDMRAEHSADVLTSWSGEG